MIKELDIYGYEITGLVKCNHCHGTGYILTKPTVKQMKKIAEIIQRNP